MSPESFWNVMNIEPYQRPTSREKPKSSATAMSAKYCAKASAAFRSLQQRWGERKQLLLVQKKGGVVKMIGFTMLDRPLLFTSSVQVLPYARKLRHFPCFQPSIPA